MRRLVVAAVLLSACGGPGPRERFAAEVLPVLERRCLSGDCHGVAPGAEAAGDHVDRRFFYIDVDAAGRTRDVEAAYRITKTRINTAERPEWSSLIRKALRPEAGGLPHAATWAFASLDAPDCRVVLDWIASERDGGEGAPWDDLAPLERVFADSVLPVLRDRGCMQGGCHGPPAFGGAELAPPMLGAGGAFSVAEARRNHATARRHLALAGDVLRSRLLAKAMPLGAGGVLHRGGNDGFFTGPDDPGARAIAAWAAAEQAAVLGGPPRVEGVLFVRGPALPRKLTDLGEYRPGSDVWLYPGLAPGAQARNLTAAAHPAGPADVRDPAVSHDGRRVLFAMRVSEDDSHNVYEMALDGSGLRQLTFDRGALPGGGKDETGYPLQVVNRWPLYGPGGRIYFVSNRAGEADETWTGLDLDVWALRPGEEPVRLTHTPTPELAPAFLAVGELRGTLAFTTLRRTGAEVRGPVFRFPPDRSPAHPQPDYHPHFGQTAPAAITWGLRELPDGRNVAVLLDHDNLWQGGALAVIERQLGPDLDAARVPQASVPGFRHALSLVDPAASAGKDSPGGMYRDPAPLPDGRLLVAHARGPLDLASPHAGAAPDTAIHVATLGTRADGAATLAALEPLVDAPGLADDQPAVVAARPEEDEHHADAWDPERPTALLRHSGVPAVHAVLHSLPPVGARPVAADAPLARLIGMGPVPLAGTARVDPAAVANGDRASSRWSNGVHGPSHVLAELPLEADGSFLAEIPARTPLRVQLVDRDGLAVQPQSWSWLSALGGETVPQGVPAERYPRLCAGCHGALDGQAGHALPDALDAVTSASMTLAAYQDLDPRRPRAPVVVAPAAGDFDFGRDLGPVLVRSCALAGCHAGPAPAGGLALVPTPTPHYDAAYEALQAFGEGSTGGKRYLDERGASARGSYLAEKLLGRELDAPRALTAPCPPPGAAPLDPAEVRAFLRWMDLGAIYRSR